MVTVMDVAEEPLAAPVAWGPLCVGFDVRFPDGTSGRVREIRPRGRGAELVVATGSRRGLVSVDATDVEAILPRARRIVVAQPPDQAGHDATAVVGGIVRLPARDASRLGAPPEDAP